MIISPKTNRHNLGFSLVELMVAMVIGLIASLAVFQVLDNFEGRKRTTTSVNDINQSGSYAISVLDKLIRSAGSGLWQGDGAILGCSIHATKGGTILPRSTALPAPFANISTGTANVFRLVPLVIVPAVGPNQSDALVIMNGNSGYGEMATPFSASPQAAKLTLNNGLGFSANDLILISKRGNTDACLITQASAANNTGEISLGGSYYSNSINGKSFVDFLNTKNLIHVKGNPNASATVANLGNITNGNPPALNVLGIGGQNTLFAYDLLQNQNAGNTQSPYPIADGVWAMFARYGVDTNEDNILDTWTTATGDYQPGNLNTRNIIRRIKAVKVGLIMRTSLFEKEEISAPPVELFGDLGESLKISKTFSGDDAHYRYRTIEITVPLRNSLLPIPSELRTE